MRTADYVHSIGRAVGAARGRSWLTALGIAIGIFAVALLTSIGEGVRIYLLDSFSQFGTNIVAVTPGRVTTQGIASILSTQRPLSLADAESLRRIPSVQQVIPVVSGAGQIKAGRRSRSTDVIGVNHEAALGWKLEVASGHFLPDDPYDTARLYCVLGSKLKMELFGHENALGQTLRVGGSRFRVVGVMRSKGQFLGFDLDDMLYIPANRALELFNRNSLMEVDIVYAPGTKASSVAQAIKRHLSDRHGEEDFTLFTQDDMLASLDKILTVLKLAIAALGSVSLFVGGVGVLTIMTTALSERKMELGLLRALGGTRWQVLWLFLGESMVTALLGGMLGILLVLLVIIALQVGLPALPVVLQPHYIGFSLLLSCLVGLLAGMAPAWNASRLDPIEALRSDS